MSLHVSIFLFSSILLSVIKKVHNSVVFIVFNPASFEEFVHLECLWPVLVGDTVIADVPVGVAHSGHDEGGEDTGIVLLGAC